MSTTTKLEQTARVIDADSHLIEPADLWTSRVASKYRDLVPRVVLHPKTQHHHWVVGSTFIWPVGYWCRAGFDGYVPEVPWEYSDIDAGGYDAAERLKRMDEYGLSTQIIYPNVIGFESELIRQLGSSLALLCTQTYNDFLLDWTSADSSRLIPIAMLPYWDRDAAVAEMTRCVNRGHHGVLFADKFERVNLPSFVDPYWDQVYAAAQDLEIPINFHIGFSSEDTAAAFEEDSLAIRRASTDLPRKMTQSSASTLVRQADLFGALLMSDVCERFPRLKFVAVESGFGHLPFYLETLDWHSKVYGYDTRQLLPSEYFRRQCYGTFWFEQSTLPLLSVYPENFMFSTDYPHGSSLSPGPASPALHPTHYVNAAVATLGMDLAMKTIETNARRVYGL